MGKLQMNSNRKSKVAAVISILSTIIAPHAFANNNEKVTKQDEVETITVLGIRGSLKQSINNKRISTEVMDSISAEDIGQLPDENIAEALQRVTGVQMSRTSDGEGSSIQIRGISNNNIEINGQTASGTGADREVNFQDLPSELFSGIDVLKAPTADRIEGSLGGTVNLRTRRPLNIEEDQIATITGKIKYSETPDDFAPDLNLFFAKIFHDTDFGDFGIILNGGSKNVVSQTDAFGGGDYTDAAAQWIKRTGISTANAIGSGPFDFATNTDINGDGVADENDVYYAPGITRSFSRSLDSQRDSINLSIDWQPNDALNLFADFTYNNSQQDETGAQLQIVTQRFRSHFIDGYDNIFTDLGDGSYVLEQGLVGGANIRYGNVPSTKTIWRESQKFSIGGDYQVNDSSNVTFIYSTTEGEMSTDQSSLSMHHDYQNNNKATANDFQALLEFDYSGSVPTIYYYDPASLAGLSNVGELANVSGIDITSLGHPDLTYYNAQRTADFAKNSEESAQLDLTYELDGEFFTQIKTGVRYSEKEFNQRRYNNVNRNKNIGPDENGLSEAFQFQNIEVDPALNSSDEEAEIATALQQCFGDANFNIPEGGNVPSSFATTNCDQDFITEILGLKDLFAFNQTLGAGVYERPGDRYKVEEETLAAYVRFDFNSELFELPLFGNFGVRYIDTETTSTGLVPEGNVYESISLDGDYQEALPSVNINLSLTDDTLLRFAAYGAIQRPSLTKLAPGITLKESADIGEGIAGTARLGNPNLNPVKAANLDLSYEWYYSENSMLSATVFYKDIESTIATSPIQQELEIIGETWLATQPANLDGTKLKGVELNLVHAFDHLEGLWANTGVSVNYTYTTEDSSLKDQDGADISRKDLSENSANFATYYDDGTLSIRLAYNWRDDFTRRENVPLGFGSEYFLPEIEKARGQLDWSANYTVNDNLKINFSASNLTDTVNRRFMKYEQLTNFVSQSGRRFNLGVVYRF